MKLDSYIMFEAFAAKDWGRAISCVERHFGFKAPRPENIVVKHDRTFYSEIVIFSGANQYLWCEHHGFRCFSAWGHVDTQTPISIYSK